MKMTDHSAHGVPADSVKTSTVAVCMDCPCVRVAGASSAAIPERIEIFPVPVREEATVPLRWCHHAWDDISGIAVEPPEDAASDGITEVILQGRLRRRVSG